MYFSEIIDKQYFFENILLFICVFFLKHSNKFDYDNMQGCL